MDLHQENSRSGINEVIYILNLIFTKTNEDLEITGNSADVTFSLNKVDDENGITEKESLQESDSSAANNEDVLGDEETPCNSRQK